MPIEGRIFIIEKPPIIQTHEFESLIFYFERGIQNFMWNLYKQGGKLLFSNFRI